MTRLIVFHLLGLLIATTLRRKLASMAMVFTGRATGMAPLCIKATAMCLRIQR